MTTSSDRILVGRGESISGKRDRFASPPHPGLAAIRYADPAAWITANAIAEAIDPIRAPLLAVGDRVAVILNAAEGPVEAIAAMHQAALEGFSSPIRFPASNPGSLAGVSSIAFGFRGPTLVLTMPAARGVALAVLLASAWLDRRVADYVVIASAGGLPATRCLVLGNKGSAIAGAAFDREGDAAWLAAVPGKGAGEAR